MTGIPGGQVMDLDDPCSGSGKPTSGRSMQGMPEQTWPDVECEPVSDIPGPEPGDKRLKGLQPSLQMQILLPSGSRK